jgi:HPt (histidine-containing phosphotransfer) domain-containing protein
VPGPPSDLEAVIAALWRDAQPRVMERLGTVEDAEHARREAHKLAGALGTFGMPAGTDRARDVERCL